MADTKISALPPASTPLAGTEVLPIVQSGTTSKVSISDLTAGRAVSMTSATLSDGTANGVAYLNGSKVLTTGSALTFNGSQLNIPLGSAAAPALSTPTDTNTGIFFPAADTIAFAEGGVEAMRIDSSGQVGIGFTPLATQGNLQVYKNISGGAPATSGSTDANQVLGVNAASVQLSYGAYASGTGWIQQRAGGNFAVNYDLVLQPNGGNVGIGTSSPSNPLDVNGISRFRQEIQFNPSGTVQSRIGISTYSGSNTVLSIGNDSGVTANTLAFYPAGTERMRIASTGIVTMSAYGAGAATFSAAGVISSVSDETWKTKDGAPVDPDAMLKKLEPGYWYYNDEKKETFGADRQLGFYAQNVNAAIGPEAAPEPEEGKPWGYYDRSVLAVVVMSLQKALATIESLEARIATLESKL